MDIEGKVALITGGAGGLGKCVGELLLSRAAQGVVFIDKDEDMGKVTEDYLKKTYGESKVVFVHGDVTVKLNLKCAYEMTKSKFGRLDIVCNNAGIFNELEMEKMFAVNIMALITSTYMAVEYMGKQHGGQGGVIINVSSNLGLIPMPYGAIYCATKHGSVGFTRSVAMEPLIVDNGIRVAVICPGLIINTSLNPELNNRYSDKLVEMKQDIASTLQPSTVAEGIAQMIGDDTYNGCACSITSSTPLTIVEHPNVQF